MSRAETRKLTSALRALANYVEAHEASNHLAARLWCYDKDEDLSEAMGSDIIDQTLGNILHDLVRIPSPGAFDGHQALDVHQALCEYGLLTDLEADDYSAPPRPPGLTPIGATRSPKTRIGWTMPQPPAPGPIPCAHPVSPEDGWSLYWALPGEDHEPWEGDAEISWPFRADDHASAEDMKALGFTYVL